MNTLPTLSVPKYRLTIPSTKEEVSYRPYLVREEKLLMIASETEDGNQIQDAIVQVVEDCVDYNGDVKNLTSSDLEYIFIQLRSKSVGEKIEIAKKCEECDATNEVIINLDNIIMENADSIDGNLEVDDNLIIEIKYPTLSSNIDHGDLSDTELLIKAAAASITTIYYGDDTYDAKNVSSDEREEFIGNLSNEQFNKIIDYLMKAPYVAYKGSYTCNKCGHKHEFYYTGLIDFFI